MSEPFVRTSGNAYVASVVHVVREDPDGQSYIVELDNGTETRLTQLEAVHAFGSITPANPGFFMVRCGGRSPAFGTEADPHVFAVKAAASIWKVPIIAWGHLFGRTIPIVADAEFMDDCTGLLLPDGRVDNAVEPCSSLVSFCEVVIARAREECDR